MYPKERFIVNFISTRGGEKVTGDLAILKGLAENGGLFVPEQFPAISREELEAMLETSYAERTAKILMKYLDGLDEEELTKECEKVYADFGEDPAPLVRLDDGIYMLELWHGPSCGYQDIPLAIFPYLLKKSAETCGVKEQILILVATSGDTGKAALESFKDVEGVKVLVFYPAEGVSKMQKLQLTVQDGDNLNVVAVRGSFDDCQSAVKDILVNGAAELKNHNTILSTANSINIGRLLTQIAYYFSAYLDLVSGGQIELGEEIDFTVPAGNFGNVIAAYYAKKMGLPIRRIHCASNLNNTLADFLSTGVYDIHRELVKTTSPSMDMLIASDIERLIFEISGRDAALTAERMKSLKDDLKYEITPSELAEIQKTFDGGFASEETSVEAMYDVFIDVGYTMDTNTGCAMKVAQDWFEKNKKDETNMVIVSTANPYKFPQDVLYAVTGNDVKDSFKGVKRLHAATAMKVPKCISALRDMPARFTKTVDPKKLFAEVLESVK